MKKKLLSRPVTIVVLVLLLVSFGGMLYWVGQKGHTQLEELEGILKITGIFAAALFFLYKLFTGWLILNLNVRLETERVSADRAADHLAVTVVLTKGTTDSVWLEDVVIRVRPLGDVVGNKWPQYIRPVGLERLNPHWKQWKPEEKNRMLNISPGEEARFAAYIQVSADSVIELEAVVFGTRPFYNLESSSQDPIQWKSSKIVLPVVRPRP